MPPRVPTSLVRNLEKGRCVLFAGAGLSAWAHLPTWRQLLEAMVEEVRNETLDDDGGELDRLIERGKYLELADHCREELGPRYTELLAERLRADEGDVPEAHRLVIGMPFAAWVTTNYDKLLERAYAEVRGGWPRTLTHLDADSLGMALFDGTPFILKAHGDIDRPDSVVLTTGDYRTLIHANPAFNAVFSAILLTNAVLFVGYSLSDPDFRLLLDRQLTTFRTFVPDRYAIMADIGDVEREVLWRTARIKVLTYEKDHTWVLEFLRALQAAVAPAQPEVVEPPATRSTRGATRSRATPRAMPGPTERPALPTAVTRDAAHELSLVLQAGRIDARLLDPEGGVVAQGTGPDIQWPALVQGVGAVHASHGAVPTGQIGDLLAGLLPHAVMGPLEGFEAPLRLRLDRDIEALPWELTPVGDHFLSSVAALVRAPTGISDRARGVPVVRSPARALLIGDPTTPSLFQLAGARREVQRIDEILTGHGCGCTTLLGDDATLDRVVAELQSDSYDVLHFAGHAWYDAVEVYLLLADDVRLTSAELRPLLSRRPPALVFLDSHYTAFFPPTPEAVTSGPDARSAVRAGRSGRVGFVEELMRAGVGAFIGCFGSPTDDGAVELAVGVHARLASGVTVAEALRDARIEAAALLDADATPLLYSLSGYGSLRIA